MTVFERKNMLIERRALMLAFVSSLSLAAYWRTAFADVDRIVQIYWEIPKERESDAKAVLQDGLTMKDDANGQRIAPLVIIAGAVALTYIVHSAIELYKDARYGGVVLSAKDGVLEISNDPRLPGGTVVVNNNNNIQVLQTTRQNEGEVVSKLAPLLQK